MKFYSVLAWEIAFGNFSDVAQKITPTLLFANTSHGRAEEAIHFYTSIFENSTITGILKYQAGESEPEGTVKHVMFNLLGQRFMAVDSTLHSFSFNEAITIIINCQTQAEVGYYWDKLKEGGEEGPYNWLKDKFGVSWQVELDHG